MTFFMTLIAQGNAVADIIGQVRIKSKRLDVMSIQHFISRPTILTGVIIPLFDRFPPFQCLCSVSGLCCMPTSVRLGRIKLYGNHSSAASMGTKDETITPILSFGNLRRVTFKLIAAKITGQDRFFDPQPLICAFSGAVDFLLVFNNLRLWLSPIFVTYRASIGDRVRQRSTFAAAIGRPSNKRRGSFNSFLAIFTSKRQLLRLPLRATCATAKTLLGILIPVTVTLFWDDFSANFTAL